MNKWSSYTQLFTEHTVVGQLLVQHGVYSPQLDNSRDIFVWLPPSYDESDRAYPVLYMHDAQNLFDGSRSYAGEWQVDETLTALSHEGLEAIVVGLPNNEHRRREYSPYASPAGAEYNGVGDRYLAFIVETIKPLIDQTFRTLTDAPYTTLAGSSMGGLISLYGFLMYPTVFGQCGVFSPAYWFGANGLIKTVRERADGRGKIYLDVGTAEGYIFAGLPVDAQPMIESGDSEYVQGVRDLRDALLEAGYHDANLLYIEDEGAPHNEGAWAKRLPRALQFLLG